LAKHVALGDMYIKRGGDEQFDGYEELLLPD
jgi:hypothetical protein